MISRLEDNEDHGRLLYSYRCSQLWEHRVTSLFLENNYDFIICKGDGKSVFSITGQSQRIAPNQQTGQLVKLHTLDSFDYLKFEPSNFIEVDEIDPDNRTIRIMYDTDPFYDENENYQNELRDVKLVKEFRFNEPNLEELLTLRSALMKGTGSNHIVELLQGDLNTFYTYFLELDFTNMTCILASNSRCIMKLLQNEDEDHFPESLFHKMRVQYK